MIYRLSFSWQKKKYFYRLKTRKGVDDFRRFLDQYFRRFIVYNRQGQYLFLFFFLLYHKNNHLSNKITAR